LGEFECDVLWSDVVCCNCKLGGVESRSNVHTKRIGDVCRGYGGCYEERCEKNNRGKGCKLCERKLAYSCLPFWVHDQRWQHVNAQVSPRVRRRTTSTIQICMAGRPSLPSLHTKWHCQLIVHPLPTNQQAGSIFDGLLLCPLTFSFGCSTDPVFVVEHFADRRDVD
jgi:hypothetical protein